jgi:AmmeMemoRadiSam system protein B/AmmeMemoRadiSam system protein A
MDTSRSISRPPAVAGLFYQGRGDRLRAQVAGLMSAGPHDARTGPAPKMLLVPHAGFVYSGPVAAHAYRTLLPVADRIARVVLLGPSHRVRLRGLALPSATSFETPLGPVPIDAAARERLADLPQVRIDDRAHASEHALEVQLPFLQVVLPAFTLVPLVVGQADTDEVAEVIERLWGGEETLILISSDLSHYHPYERCRAIDRATLDDILALRPVLDPEQACGAWPLNGALACAARHALQPRLLDLRNSGDTAGPRDEVVGYGAVAFDAPGPVQDTLASVRDAPAQGSLGRTLLAHARDAIGRRFAPAGARPPSLPELDAPGATFVTLMLDGDLRGCIGSLQAERPLREDVRDNAIGAAFHDPRFAPLSADEWPRVGIEVSLLEPAQRMTVRDEADACAQLRPGLDGVTLRWHGRRATFLPQVWASLPEPREFLRQLKRKAGLPDAFWAPDLVLERYTVRKWTEADPSAGGAA